MKKEKEPKTILDHLNNKMVDNYLKEQDNKELFTAEKISKEFAKFIWRYFTRNDSTYLREINKGKLFRDQTGNHFSIDEIWNFFKEENPESILQKANPK